MILLGYRAASLRLPVAGNPPPRPGAPRGPARALAESLRVRLRPAAAAASLSPLAGPSKKRYGAQGPGSSC
eukprot:2340743-Rhodomonas_salina.1